MLYAVGFLCLAVFGGALYKSRTALDSLNSFIEEGLIVGKPIVTLLSGAVIAAGAGKGASFAQGIIGSLLLMIHEGGHFLFCSLIPIGGKISCSGGGSFIECLFPFFFFVLFFLRGSFWVASLFLSLFSFSIFSTSRYVGDAVQRALPLIASPEAFLSGNTNISDHHDWHVVFSELGILDYAPELGATLYYLGWFIGAVSVVLPWAAPKFLKETS